MYYTLVNGNTQDSWARWQPTLPVDDAIYEIMVYIPDVAANTTTWQATYTIRRDGGTSTAVVDHYSRCRKEQIWQVNPSVPFCICCSLRRFKSLELRNYDDWLRAKPPITPA